MNKTVILIGVGEIGGVFAKAILRTGHSVYPVARGTNLTDIVKDAPDPLAVVVAVGEKDIESVLESIPQAWQDRLVLVQNELLPRDWQAHNIENPTVISVWFEKKKGQDAKVIIPSPIYGPHAEFVQSALRSIDIDCKVVDNSDELLYELVLKNIYILTVNIVGLVIGGTVGELWEKHEALARETADNVMDIQFKLIEKDLDRESLINGMVKAFRGDLDHKCMGRSAPARLERAISLSDEFQLNVNKLREIHESTSNSPVSNHQ